MEEKIFVNKTYIKEREHKALNKTVFNSKMTPMIIVYQVMALIFMIYGFIVKNYFIAITFGVLLVCFPALMILLSRLRTIKLYNKYKELYANLIYTFTFYDNFVKIDLSNGNKQSSGKFNYQDLSVIEDKENIYLFISATNAYVVSKEGFEKNYDPLGFRSVVLGKVKKYKIKKRG